MTTFAQGSRSQVAFIAETTFGTTPATPTLVALPITAFNLNMTRSDFKDATIRADRMTRFSISGTRSVTGDFTTELSHGNMDAFVAAAVNSAWSTNVLKTGTTQTSFSIENGQLDASVFSLYKGCMVDKLSITVPVNNIVTAQCTIVGQDMAVSGATVATTLTPAAANTPFTHLGGTIKEGGTVIATVTQIQLDIQNSLASNYVLGAATAPSITYGMSQVSGTVTAYFADSSLFTKFVQGTASSIDFTLTDGTNTYEILVPNVKYTAGTKNINGQGPVSISFTFTGLYDQTTGSDIVITRSS